MRSSFCPSMKYINLRIIHLLSYRTSFYYGLVYSSASARIFYMQNNICYLSRAVIVFANDLFIYYMPKTIIKYMCHVALCFFIGTHFLCQKAQMSKTFFSLSFTILYTEVLDYVRVLSTKKFC